MKKFFKIIAITSVVLLVGSVLVHQNCPKKIEQPQQVENEFKLPEETFRPPLIKLPFSKTKIPIKKKVLPIPIKDIAKTIEVGKNVVIVIDKKGEIYTTKDTSKDIPIKVVVWKPRLMAFESRWGATLAMTVKPDMYFCLSWSFIRVGGVHFGVDVGMNTKALEGYMGDNYLLGVAGRYRILKNNEIYLTGGYEFTHKAVYIGITVIF